MQQDSTRLSVLVVWEHITASDRKMGMPTTSVLMRITDPRARQYWDEGRLVSKAMVRDLPRDTIRSLAEVDSAGTAVVWDCVALFGAGLKWESQFPLPDWAGRPVADQIAALRLRLAAAPLSPSDSRR